LFLINYKKHNTINNFYKSYKVIRKV